MSQEKVEKADIKPSANKEATKPSVSAPDNQKVKAKSNKRNPFVQVLLSLLTLGVFSRFCPRNKEKKGGWGVTVILLALACAGLVGERFYKEEINQMAKEQLAIDADILPKTLPFEEGAEAKVEQEAAQNEKIASLEAEKQNLENKLAEAKTKLESLGDNTQENAAQVATLEAEVKSLESQKDNLNKTIEALSLELNNAKEALQLEKSKVPTINFSSITSASEEVGCKTSFSEERANDLFSKEYKGHWVEWNGFVKSANKEQVEIVSKEDSKDVAVVKFEKEGAGYYLLKGQEITMRFILENNASCKDSFYGHTGFEIKD